MSPAAGDRTYPAVREAVKALAGVIGWLGASIAGLTALCYGAGYFVIHTHLSMLGLSDIVDVSNDQLLLEGGRFFYWTLGQLAIGGMIIVVIATVICVIARIIYEVPLVSGNRVVRSMRGPLTGAKAKRIWADLLSLGAIAIVVLHFDLYYDPTNSILTLKNLVFSAPSTGTSQMGRDTASMIMSGSEGDRASLIGSYNFFVRVYALFIVVTWVMIFKGSSTAYGKAANFLFIVYTVLLTAFLPQAFAVFVRTPFYPVDDVALKNGHQVHGLIVQKTDRAILIWDPQTKRATSLNTDDVSTYEVDGERDIFAKEQRP